jgi:hypothetical protein
MPAVSKRACLKIPFIGLVPAVVSAATTAMTNCGGPARAYQQLTQFVLRNSQETLWDNLSSTMRRDPFGGSSRTAQPRCSSRIRPPL